MRIAVFGAGAVGGYFGGRLALAGHDVQFIARGPHYQAMRSTGLKVESLKGDFLLHPVAVKQEPEQVGTVDAVVLGVKAWQVKEAARAIKPMIGPDTCVLPLQNGVEASGHLSDALGSGSVLGGVCRIIGMRVGPGHIRHSGAEPFVAFGELDNRKSERIERLLAAFIAAGVQATIADDIHAAIWQKFLFIAAWSGVGAVTRAPIGAFRRVPETRTLLEESMREILALARTKRIQLPEDAIAKTTAFVDKLPADATASMQRDIMEGQPSELFDQTGAVVRLATEAGIKTPVNAFIFHCLLPLELRARGELRF